jgi:hypothetical protein
MKIQNDYDHEEILKVFQLNIFLFLLVVRLLLLHHLHEVLLLLLLAQLNGVAI